MSLSERLRWLLFGAPAVTHCTVDVTDLGLVGQEDRVIIESERRMSNEEITRLLEHWDRALREKKAIVLDGGIRIRILRGLRVPE